MNVKINCLEEERNNLLKKIIDLETNYSKSKKIDNTSKNNVLKRSENKNFLNYQNEISSFIQPIPLIPSENFSDLPKVVNKQNISKKNVKSDPFFILHPIKSSNEQNSLQKMENCFDNKNQEISQKYVQIGIEDFKKKGIM